MSTKKISTADMVNAGMFGDYLKDGLTKELSDAVVKPMMEKAEKEVQALFRQKLRELTVREAEVVRNMLTIGDEVHVTLHWTQEIEYLKTELEGAKAMLKAMVEVMDKVPLNLRRDLNVTPDQLSKIRAFANGN